MYKSLHIASLWCFLRRKWEPEIAFKKRFSDKYSKKFYIKIKRKKSIEVFFGGGQFRTNAKWVVRSFVFWFWFFLAHDDSTRARFSFDFFLRITLTCAILKTNQKKRGLTTMRVLLRYKEPVCLLLSFAAILLVVTVYGLTHGFDSSATVDHKSPQILQELLPVDD